MTPGSYITTSWDDGHPLDFRIADLLAKYGLCGTFYVPMTAERRTMTAAQLRQLSRGFEIGGHTLNHVVLSRATDEQARAQIADGKSWIEDSTGGECLMFCPPQGRYRRRHLAMIGDAGHIALRSVELCALDFPRPQANLMVMPTSVQAYPHASHALARNAMKRAAWANLWRGFNHSRSGDWTRMAHGLLRIVVERGGVFHLWGHSWEIEEAGQWRLLADLLAVIGEFAGHAEPLTNGEICLESGADAAFELGAGEVTA